MTRTRSTAGHCSSKRRRRAPALDRAERRALLLRGAMQVFARSALGAARHAEIARATELANAFGTDEVMFVFKYGSMPMSTAEKRLRLFAKEAMPALQELSPAPLTPNCHATELSMSQH